MTRGNPVAPLDRPMQTPPRKLARIAGVLFIVTFITSIPAPVLAPAAP